MIRFSNGTGVSVVRGANVCIRNNRVFVNGKEVTSEGSPAAPAVKIEVVGEGSIGSIESDDAVYVEKGVTINGSVSAGGSVACDAVNGSVSAGGTVNCGNVAGGASAGGTVNCSNARNVSDSRSYRH